MLPFVDGAIERAQEAMVEQFKESITAFMIALADVIQEMSYAIALLGGGACLIIWAIARVEKAKQVGLVLVLVHAFIRFL